MSNSVKPKRKFWPSAEAEPSVVKITEYSAEDEASAEDRSFCKSQKLLWKTEHYWPLHSIQDKSILKISIIWLQNELEIVSASATLVGV